MAKQRSIFSATNNETVFGFDQAGWLFHYNLTSQLSFYYKEDIIPAKLGLRRMPAVAENTQMQIITNQYYVYHHQTERKKRNRLYIVESRGRSSRLPSHKPSSTRPFACVLSSRSYKPSLYNRGQDFLKSLARQLQLVKYLPWDKKTKKSLIFNVNITSKINWKMGEKWRIFFLE